MACVCRTNQLYKNIGTWFINFCLFNPANNTSFTVLRWPILGQSPHQGRGKRENKLSTGKYPFSVNVTARLITSGIKNCFYIIPKF